MVNKCFFTEYLHKHVEQLLHMVFFSVFLLNLFDVYLNCHVSYTEYILYIAASCYYGNDRALEQVH